MKKVLIVYATREGQTEKIAKQITKHLLDQGCQVDLFDAKQVSLESFDRYDFILCGGSMHIGGIEHELIDFVTTNKQIISSQPNAFFLVLLSAATKDKGLREQWLKDAGKKLHEQIPMEFDRIEMVAGALVYSKYSWPMKWIMRRIAQKAGEGTDLSKDYEYTDWQKVKKFAESIITT